MDWPIWKNNNFLKIFKTFRLYLASDEQDQEHQSREVEVGRRRRGRLLHLIAEKVLAHRELLAPQHVLGQVIVAKDDRGDGHGAPVR